MKSVVKLRIFFFFFLRNCIVRMGDWRFQSWIFQLKKPKCVHLNYNFTRICNLICYVFTCIFIVSCFFHAILSQDFNSFFTFYCWNFDTWIEFLFFFFTQLYHTMRLLFFLFRIIILHSSQFKVYTFFNNIIYLWTIDKTKSVISLTPKNEH